MNQIINNVQALLDKYGEKTLNTNHKLSLMYWKEFEQLKFDGKHISTQDYLNTKTSTEDIINAKYMLNLMGDDKE